MDKNTVFSHSNKGHLPAKLQVSNSGEHYWIELYNEGGGNTNQQWHSEVFKRDAIQSMVMALSAHFASLPPVGTFNCPICGRDAIHNHTSNEIAEHRIAAAPLPQVQSEALDTKRIDWMFANPHIGVYDTGTADFRWVYSDEKDGKSSPCHKSPRDAIDAAIAAQQAIK